MAIGNGGVDVDGGGDPRVDVGMGIGDDMGGGIDDAAKGLCRRGERHWVTHPVGPYATTGNRKI